MDDYMMESDLSVYEIDEMTDFSDDESDMRMLMEADVEDVCKTYVDFRQLNILTLLQYALKPVMYLTVEERDIIRRLENTELVRLFVLNRAQFSIVREMVKQMQKFLSKCNRYVAKNKECAAELKIVREIMLKDNFKFDMWKAAAPYFKDTHYFPAPLNADTIQKQQNGELCLLVVNEGRRWVSTDRSILAKSIKIHYYEYRYNQLKKGINIKEVIAKHEVGDKKMGTLTDIDFLKNLLEDIKPEFPPYNVIDGIDWTTIANDALKGRHSVVECIAFWNMVLHPNLNKSQWTSVEEEKLQELAKKYNFQDWDAIISELGTNRSPFAAAKHYLTNFSTKYNRDRFTPEEDGYLMEVVKSVEIGSYIPWGKVAYYFENRSRYQLYHRYKYYLAYKNTKKGLFTVEEDALLIFLVNKFGKVFNKIAEYFPNRAPIQLRNRYGCYWNSSDLQYGSYSYEDDLTILNYVEEHGEKSWGKLALTLQRTRAHVRQRYTTLRKWLLSNPELHLLDIPKRSRTLIQQNHSFRNKRVAEILADINDSDDIPKLEDLEQLTHLKMRKDNASKKFHNDLDFDSVDMELRDAVVWPYASKRYMDREKRIKSTERITKLLKMFNQDIDGLIHPDEDYKVFNVRIELFMSYLKNTLEPEAAISIKKEEADKLIIAPNLATIISFSYIRAHLGVVGNENRVSEDLKINIRLKLEHSVLNYNDVVPLEYDKEQLFMQRAYYTFKWSNILSEMYTCLNLKACETTNSTPSANPVIKEEENEESSLYHLTDKNMPPVKKSQTSQLTLKINIADVKKPANKRTHGQTKMFHAKVIRMSKPSLTKEVVNNTLSPTKVIKTDDCFSAHTDIKKISDSKVINVFDPNYRIWTFPKTDPKNFDTIFAKNKDFDMIVFRSCMQPSTSGSTFENFNAVTNVIADNVNVNSELVKSSNEFQIHVVPTFSPNIKEEKDDSSSFYDDNGNLNF